MVDLEDDPVGQALCLDNCLAMLAGKGECHGEDRLQGVPLGAAARAAVGLAARHADAVVEDSGDGVARDAGTVVDDVDHASIG
jgi:hypothetical protein